MFDGFKGKILVAISLLALLPFYLLSREVFIAASQVHEPRQKEVKQAGFPNEPVEIIEISNAANPHLKLGVKFEQASDWIKDFSLKIKNNSDKKITFLMFVMEFPETKKSGNEIAFPITFGSNPLMPNQGLAIRPIEPEGIFDLKVNEKKLNSLRKALESRHNLDSLSKITLRLDIIHFDDGTVWSGGSLSKPVSNTTKVP